MSHITRHWHIQTIAKSLPKPLWPNKQRSGEWSDDFIHLLSQISRQPAATLPDFKRRLRRVIKARQERNNSTIGKQSWAKEVDLKAVLKEYQREAEETGAEEEHPAPEPKEKPVNRTTRNTRVQIPKTPMNHEDADDEEEEEGSSEPLAGGKYQYLNGVRPVKVNLNPTASAAKKPLRAKPPLRGNRQKVNEDGFPDPQAVELPSLVHQDPDPRVPDDTGFLSDLEGDGLNEKGRKRRKRLSRLQQQRIREPHWQLDLDNIVVDVPDLEIGIDTPTVIKEVEAATVLDAQDEKDVTMQNVEDVAFSDVDERAIRNGQDVVMNDEEDVEIELDNLPEIPDNATVTERREMEELRLRMEQRVWRIKVLKIKEREGGGSEVLAREDSNLNSENGEGTNSRVLRKRRGK